MKTITHILLALGLACSVSCEGVKSALGGVKFTACVDNVCGSIELPPAPTVSSSGKEVQPVQ
jgi:hypothetical protein